MLNILCKRTLVRGYYLIWAVWVWNVRICYTDIPVYNLENTVDVWEKEKSEKFIRFDPYVCWYKVKTEN